MAEQEAAQVDEKQETTEAATGDGAEASTEDAAEASTEDAAEASPEDAGIADAVDERAAELTGAGDASSSDDQPISEVNRGAVDAAADHLDDSNLADDREMLKKLQQGM